MCPFLHASNGRHSKKFEDKTVISPVLFVLMRTMWTWSQMPSMEAASTILPPSPGKGNDGDDVHLHSAGTHLTNVHGAFIKRWVDTMIKNKKIKEGKAFKKMHAKIVREKVKIKD
jgi:hypothetical protein